jgi:hypothetical protein
VPVTVHIPIRLCVDADAVTSRVDAIDAALTAALSRALASSRSVVVEPRDSYLGLEVHEPAFSWSGDGLDRLPASTRRMLETHLRALVIRHAERALFDDAHVGMPEPIPADPAEPIDRRRYWAPARHYALPSYDRQGRKVLVPTKVIDFTPADTQVVDVPDWATVSDFDELLELIPDVFLERDRKPPQSGLLGFIFRSPVGPLWIQVIKFDGEKRERFWDADVTVQLPKWDQDKGTFVYVPTPIRPVGTFKLTSLGGAGNGTAEAKRILDKHLRENVLPLLVKTAPVDLEPDELDAKFAKVSTELFNGLVETHKGNIHFAQLGLPMGDQVLLLGAPVPEGTIEILPVAAWVPARLRGAGDGTGAGVGAGAAKRVLDRSILQRAKGNENAADLLLLNATATGEGSIYPKSKAALLSWELSWEPFEGEPSVDAFGEDGKLLRELMERIAHRLAITDWKPYAGRFLMNAAIVIGARAAGVQADAIGESPIGILVARTLLGGNLGKGHFTPKPSKAMAFYKYLVATAPWLNVLDDAVRRVFNSPEHASQLENLVGGRPHWLLHVREEYWPSLLESCGWIFMYACQAMMLQLLGASRHAIERRWEKREAYAEFFYSAVITQLASEADLLRLRDGLKGAIERTPAGQAVSSNDVVLAGKAPHPASLNLHAAARRDLDQLLVRARHTQQAGFFEGDITYKDGVPAILDRYTNPWTVADLDLAIQVRHSTAMALDPVLNHFLHEHKFMDVQGYTKPEARTALLALLQTMLDKNKETWDETIDDSTYAFEKGKIVEISDIDDPQYIPRNQVAGFDLQGIHLVAWQQLAPEVGIDSTLEHTIDVLFSRELGFRSLKSFGEFVGITLLAVVCLPLAEVVMVAQAVYGAYEAHKLEGFYQSFLDPEQLLSWADVQAEQFVAGIMLAISLLPYGGRIVRGALPRSRALLETGLKKGLGAQVRHELAVLFEDIARLLKKDLVTAFVSELGTNYVMSMAIEKMMMPFVNEVARRASLPAYEQ